MHHRLASGVRDWLSIGLLAICCLQCGGSDARDGVYVGTSGGKAATIAVSHGKVTHILMPYSVMTTGSFTTGSVDARDSWPIENDAFDASIPAGGQTMRVLGTFTSDSSASGTWSIGSGGGTWSATKLESKSSNGQGSIGPSGPPNVTSTQPVPKGSAPQAPVAGIPSTALTGGAGSTGTIVGVPVSGVGGASGGGFSTVVASVVGGATTIRTPASAGTVSIGGRTITLTTASMGGATGTLTSATTSAGGTTSPIGGTPTTATSTSTGGTSGAGGTTHTGGATSTVNTGTIVTFVQGKASGAMSGYAWVAGGSDDIITNPTCGADPIVPSVPCSSFTWRTSDSLCLSGSIPAIDENNPTYDTNWGLSMGVNATEPFGGGLGQPFTTMTFAISGSPDTGLLATVQRKNDPEGTTYCAPIKSGMRIPINAFIKQCFDPSSTGPGLTVADVPNITKIAILVPSTTTAISVNNLCLSGITFSR